MGTAQQKAAPGRHSLHVLIIIRRRKYARRPGGLQRGRWRARRLLLGCGLLRGSCRENRFITAIAGEEDGEGNRNHHKEDRSPRGELGEQVSCSTRAECSLRPLSAEGAGEIGRFSLLQQHYANQEQRDDNVENNQKIDHWDYLKTSKL
jgi:hypothetical protein